MTKPHTIPVDRNKLIAAMNPCFGHVKYGLGKKAPLDAKPGSFDEIDCSGFVRWLLHQATGGVTVMPDGSWNQANWCVEQHFEPCRYVDAGKKDSRLRIAFIEAHGHEPGHVWLIISALTIESYGGHGVGRRVWNTPKLLNNVHSCYVLSEVLP